VAPNKFWRQVLARRAKENNRISLHDCNSYLTKLYESPTNIDNFQTLLTSDKIFSLEDIEFEVNCQANGNAKDIEGYQEEILKIGALVLIPHNQKLFNQALEQGFPKP